MTSALTIVSRCASTWQFPRDMNKLAGVDLQLVSDDELQEDTVEAYFANPNAMWCLSIVRP
jgi:hypothetical protein